MHMMKEEMMLFPYIMRMEEPLFRKTEIGAIWQCAEPSLDDGARTRFRGQCIACHARGQ